MPRSFKLYCRSVARRALREDKAFQDVTTHSLFPRSMRVRAHILAKEDGILCSLPVVEAVFSELDPHLHVRRQAQEGHRVRNGQVVVVLEGSVWSLLAGERTALNILQHLSGVSTLTSRYVREARGTKAHIFDTRKTLPGIRRLQKYAVHTGGGRNHRMDLSSDALVKDNHLKVLRLCRASLATSLQPMHGRWEVEAESRSELMHVLSARPPYVLLDNMPLPRLRAAVRLVRRLSPATHVEVSGGVRLEQVRPIARLGVERISVGRLTHSATSMDFSLEIDSVLPDDHSRIRPRTKRRT